MDGRVNQKRRSAQRRLPASLERAWGIRDRSPRGPKPGLSLARIVAAAADVASSDGLAAVSMSRVAAALGVATMSLYRYVGAKEELLALMVDAAFESPPPAPADGWRRGLTRWARAHLAVLRQRPWVVRVPIGGPPVLPNQMVWFERGLACLGRTSLSERQKVSVLLLVNGFVRSEALLASDLETAARAAGGPAKEARASYGRLLSTLIDRQRFPAIGAAIDARVFEGPDGPLDEFDFGLERLLDGVAALMREAGRRRSDGK